MFRKLTKEQRRQRAKIGLIGLVVLLIVLVFLSRQDAPGHERVAAMIVAIDRGTHEDNPIALFTARVQLQDGTEARVVVHDPLPAVGDNVQLIEVRQADGSRRFRLDQSRQRIDSGY